MSLCGLQLASAGKEGDHSETRFHAKPGFQGNLSTLGFLDLQYSTFNHGGP